LHPVLGVMDRPHIDKVTVYRREPSPLGPAEPLAEPVAPPASRSDGRTVAVGFNPRFADRAAMAFVA